jgi:hypothetical protein
MYQHSGSVWIRMLLGHLNTPPDLLVRGTDKYTAPYQNVTDPQHCLPPYRCHYYLISYHYQYCTIYCRTYFRSLLGQMCKQRQKHTVRRKL